MLHLTMRGGVLLREARERAGLTQAALASRVGTTQSAIARIENGGEPTLRRLSEVLAACGVTPQIRLARFEGGDDVDTRHAWNPTEPVRALRDGDVRFLVAGRAAASLHGVPVEVGVPVVVVDLAAVAVDSLSATLGSLHARRRVGGETHDPEGDGGTTLPLDRTPAGLRTRRRWELATTVGAIDVDFEPPGTRGYADLIRAAVEIDGLAVASAADTARQLDAERDDLAAITRLRQIA
jgi:transcriptional regulator with XRE-family HTH domain